MILLPLRPLRAGLAAMVLAVSGLAVATEASHAPVDGLLVHLRQAPAHSQWRANALAAPGAAAARQQWRQTWQGVLSRSGLAAEAGLRLQPAGRAAHLLLPGRSLSAAERHRWLAALAAQPEVDWVLPNTREARQQVEWPVPDDPLFAGESGQWWLQPVSGSNANAIGARLRGVPGLQSAWSRGTGSAATVVAVLDTGLSAHPDLLSSRMLPGFDMVSDWDGSTGRGYANDGDGRDADPSDPGDWVSAADQAADPGRYSGCTESASSWHGTVVTGLIAAQANNATGGAGADWATRILPVRVAGKCGASVRDIVDGMRWAAGLAVCQTYADTQDPTAGCSRWAPLNPHPARVINLSYGGAAACHEAYQSAIDELWALGVVVVAAAGNDHAAPARPANCQHVIGVAALNRDGFKANYSNFGASLSIATVGGDDAGGRWGGLLGDSGLLGLSNSGTQGPGTAGAAAHFGTSFATPVVSATIGLMLAANPGLTATEIATGLSASARPHLASNRMPACSASNPGRCICSTSTCGAGMLDAEQAVAYAQALAAHQAYQAPLRTAAWLDTPELASALSLGPDREVAADSGSTADSATTGGGGGTTWLGLLALLACLALLPRRQRCRHR
jgi:serine protease